VSLTDWPDLAAPPVPVPVSRETGPTVFLPPLEDLARRWLEIEPLLARSTSRTGCYEPIDLLVLAMTGQAGMWLCVHGDDLLDAVLVTQVTVYPRRRVLDVIFGGGDNLHLWIKTAVREIDRHARELGCSHVASAGRPGWQRAWGCRATGDIIMVREI